jgi:hypothetical protein
MVNITEEIRVGVKAELIRPVDMRLWNNVCRHGENVHLTQARYMMGANEDEYNESKDCFYRY